jgi:hypothetical protein
MLLLFFPPKNLKGWWCVCVFIEEQLKFFKEGNVLVLRNCNADIFNGFMRLNVTQWGKIATHPDGIASTPEVPKTVNKENNMSATEYELVTVEDEE